VRVWLRVVGLFAQDGFNVFLRRLLRLRWRKEA
jgi:hypothetical protein